MKHYDHIGDKFGRLTVLKKSGLDSKGELLWLCECSCGNRKTVNGCQLRRGAVKSCGCLRREILNHTTHGHCRRGTTPEYRSWSSMHARCYNKNHRGYKYWGGRGIKVCRRWFSFANFLVDMGKRPKRKSLDRRNNNGNYNLKNCRWATPRQQIRNRSDNKLFRVFGVTKTFWNWLDDERCRVSRALLRKRLKIGWSFRKALTTTTTEAYRQSALLREKLKRAAT